MTGARRGAPVLFIFLTVLLDSIGFGIILPVTPELIMELTGEGIDAAARYGGWLWFIYALAQFFCAPTLGNLSDRFGRRPVLLFSLAAFGLDYIIMGFAPTLAWLFTGRFVAGVAGATFSPAYAYLADVTPPDQRAANFGLVGSAFGFGFILGPAIGGLLGELGPRAPFFAAGAVALANFTFGWFALPESLPAASRRPFQWARANPLGTLVALRRHPEVLGIAAAMFLWQLGHQVLPGTWSYYAIFRYGWSEAEVGYSLAAVGVIMAIGQGGLTRVLVPRLGGERGAALVGLVAGAVCYVGYGCATAGWVVYVFMLPWLFAALVYPSMNALMSRKVPADVQGELQGGVASLYSLSAIIGPPLMTQLFAWFSSGAAPVVLPGAAFFAATLLTFGSIALLLRSGAVAAAAASASSATS